MKTYVFFIDDREISYNDLKTFKTNLKTEFVSYDYMRGYAEGYGFGKIRIATLEEFQEAYNDAKLSNKYIFFVHVDKSFGEED